MADDTQTDDTYPTNPASRLELILREEEGYRVIRGMNSVIIADVENHAMLYEAIQENSSEPVNILMVGRDRVKVDFNQ